jgi:hypothetical protein
MTGIAERVARGAALLDEKEPGWDKRIDLGKLMMWDGCRCILGQVYGSYARTCNELFLGNWDDAEAHGFNASDEDGYGKPVPEHEWHHALGELDTAWRELIKSRRAAS